MTMTVGKRKGGSRVGWFDCSRECHATLEILCLVWFWLVRFGLGYIRTLAWFCFVWFGLGQQRH